MPHQHLRFFNQSYLGIPPHKYETVLKPAFSLTNYKPRGEGFLNGLGAGMIARLVTGAATIGVVFFMHVSRRVFLGPLRIHQHLFYYSFFLT